MMELSKTQHLCQEVFRALGFLNRDMTCLEYTLLPGKRSSVMLCSGTKTGHLNLILKAGTYEAEI